ncbi:hypothetical protein MKX01_000350, partial [Papaver californicum]
NQNFIRILLSNSPILEELSLEVFRWDIQQLSIFDLNLKRLLIKSQGHKNFDIQISAPNLQSFKYSSMLARDFFRIISQHCLMQKLGEPAGYFATKLFHGVSYVKHLTVSDYSLKLLSNQDHFFKFLPTFNNLIHLEVMTTASYVDYNRLNLQCWIVEILLKFLNISPNLESLIFVDGFCDYESYPSYDWSLDLIPQCLLLHLKSIEFCGCFWNQAEKDLVRLFLKNARVLQTVRIEISGESSYFSKKSNYKKEVLKEIALFPRGSADCVLHVS